MLEDPIQMDTTVTCGPFQLYFYKNLFFPDENRKIQNYKKLKKKHYLTNFLTLDQENTKQIINKYIKQRQINIT